MSLHRLRYLLYAFNACTFLYYVGDKGHVEFFREAAKYGDLYVRLGSSKNIKMLKNHDTMYTDAERLFMVQNIKGVHDAAISLGSG